MKISRVKTVEIQAGFTIKHVLFSVVNAEKKLSIKNFNYFELKVYWFYD